MKFLDFFSGIGGFRLGFEMAGHECVGHCEIDKYANKSYAAMHDMKESEWFAEDITKVRSSDIPRADCWCFGFPCQDISVAGKQRGFDGERSSLFFTVTNLIRWTKKEDRPKYLLIENVKNFFSVNGGYDFLKAQIELDEIGYDCEWQLLNSKDFGVPQNRERVFIIASLRGTGRREVFPIGGSNEKNLNQIVGGQQGNRVYDTGGVSCTLSSHGGGQGAKTGLYAVNVSRKTEPREAEIANCLMARDYKGIGNQAMTAVAVLTPDRVEKRQNGRRFKEDGEPMFTLTGQDRHGVAIFDFYNHKQREDGICGTLTAGGNTSSLRCGSFGILNGAKIRRLTPKECFRLQGWPDEYFERARAVNSDSQLYKQAGNGVTVNVIHEIAKRL